MRSIIILTIVCFLFFPVTHAQENKDKGQPAYLIEISAGTQMPGGDMEERFGINYNIGVGCSYKTSSNFAFGVDGSFLFGNEVKNSAQILLPLLTGNGSILNSAGNFANVSVAQRGISYGGKLGKVFNFIGVNANSGLSLYIGGGYMWHWVENINPGNDVAQLVDEEFSKGYDLLTAGPYIKQSIGYTYLSSQRRINFDISFDFMQAFTQNLRGYSYGTGTTENDTRTDLLYGITLRWYLPIYQDKGGQTYYFD